MRLVLDTNTVSISALLDRYTKLADQVTPARIRRVVLTDADDDAVLACALAAQADLIVSGDKHLRNLKSWQGMRITNAAQALTLIASA